LFDLSARLNVKSGLDKLLSYRREIALQDAL